MIVCCIADRRIKNALLVKPDHDASLIQLRWRTFKLHFDAYAEQGEHKSVPSPDNAPSGVTGYDRDDKSRGEHGNHRCSSDGVSK
jgi:hypothetical protein